MPRGPKALLIGSAFAMAIGCASNDAVLGEGPGSSSSEGGEGDTSGSGGSETGSSVTTEMTSDATGGSDETGSEGTTTTTGDTPGVPGAWCGPIPACDAEPPDPGPALGWDHTESSLAAASGGPTHRGRDMFYLPGDTQWVLGKFAYGPTDWDLEDELIDLYLMRDCEAWEPLGTTRTTYEGTHVAVEGVEDTGGRVYFEVPDDLVLGPGRHRIRMVARGDNTTADVYIEIVPEGTPIFVSDIDGTLTTFETEEFTDLLVGEIPDINPFAAVALSILAEKGYHPVYLTARPEFLGARTQEFVRERNLPPGIVHTTLSKTGALGGEAVTYKTGELSMLAERGLFPDWVFGNTDSDAEAYDNAGIEPLEQRIFFQFDDPFGGRRIESYEELLEELEALPSLCDR